MPDIPNHPLNILVIGSGGREHALSWKLSQSPYIEKIYCAPGNGGTATENKCINLDIKSNQFDSLSQFCIDKKIDLTVVGPETVLAEGIVDHFKSKNLRIFGPSKAAAKLEWSKSFAKDFMVKYNLPTAKFLTAASYQEAMDLLQKNPWIEIIKADGLALGKGVYVCNNKPECEQAIHEIFTDKKFGQAGQSIVLEERLSGEEISLFLLCDGQTFLPLAPSQDFKRRFEDNKGPNTGGMGAISPPAIFDQYKNIIEKTIYQPLLEALKQEKINYQGLLYIGLILDQSKNSNSIIPKIIEFNSRFGDPETQSIMLLLDSDLLPALWACTDSSLKDIKLSWSKESSTCVIAVHSQYPDTGSNDIPIKIPTAADKNLVIFHAGTKLTNNTLLTNGGRILAVVGKAQNLDKASDLVYKYLSNLHFDSIDYRQDIGRLKTKTF